MTSGVDPGRERRLTVFAQHLFDQGVGEPAVVAWLQAAFPPWTEFEALFRSSGVWDQGTKAFIKAVRKRAKRLAKGLGKRARTSQPSDDVYEEMSLAALGDYEDLARQLPHDAGDPIVEWIDGVRATYESLKADPSSES